MAPRVFSTIELLPPGDPVPSPCSHSGVGTPVGSRAEQGAQPVCKALVIKDDLVHRLRVLLSVASWNVVTSFPLTTGMLWPVYPVFYFECMNYHSVF